MTKPVFPFDTDRRLSPSRAWTAIAAILAVFALSLTACGSGDETLLEKIKSSGKLTVAFTAFEPQTYKAEDGSWTGYDIDILEGFAKTLDAELEIEEKDFDSSLQSVVSRRADITIDIYWNKERAEVLAFSRPMLNYYDVVAVKKSDPQVDEATLDALTDKRIGVTGGTINEDEANDTPGAKLVKYTDLADKMLGLKQGRVDAIYSGNTNLLVAEADPKNDIKILGKVPEEIAPPIEEFRGHFGVDNGDYSASFLKKLNAYLKDITCDGRLEKILLTYDLDEPDLLEGLCDAPDKAGPA